MQLTADGRASVSAYLSSKWNLTATVDSDDDGFTDAVEIAADTSAVDATSIPIPDFSDTVDADNWIGIWIGVC